MYRNLLIIPVLLLITLATLAQEDLYEELLKERVTIEDPFYKPVIGFGKGVLNFHGDVSNNNFVPFIGDNAFKFNVSANVDRGRFYKMNFFLIYGSLSGNLRSIEDLPGNLNFKTDIFNIGVNAEYSFRHFIRKSRWIHPFFSAGVSTLQFTPKGDYYDSEGNFYNYWSDGTIRDISEALGATEPSKIIFRDYVYETDLRRRERDISADYGNYGKNAFAIPVDAGIDFKLTERISCRLGTSMHFTLTDYLDNVSSKGTSVKGNKRNDMFSFNYFTIHLDLFSQPKEKIIERLFLELEFDDVMFDDEDGDFVLDPVDQCPGTPFGVAVDAVGCPFDTDGDGVPDYLDLEPNTPAGNWVDENGVTVSKESFLLFLTERSEAMSREDVMEYLNTIGIGYISKSVTEIPEKFKILDTDNDGYISFEELLKAIDNYFDYQLDMKVEDLYELNNFFFMQ